jgi:hypothetical protein
MKTGKYARAHSTREITEAHWGHHRLARFSWKCASDVVHSLVGNSQRIGQIITAELAFKNLRALSISLFKESFGEGEKFNQFRTLIERAEKAETMRNWITHSLWAAGDSPDTIIRIKMTAKEKQGFRFHSESFDETQLSDFATEIKMLAGDVQSFWIDTLMKAAELK